MLRCINFCMHVGRFMGEFFGRRGLLVGFTAVFIAYFLVWLPGPGAGLQFLGFEIGEWIKFLGVGLARNLFYLPPITLGLMLALWTATWLATPRTPGWQKWAVRGVAVAVSLLAFPAAEAVLYEPRSEWLLRLLLIALVMVVALGSHWLGRWPRLAWALILLLGLVGLVLPTWQYFAVRPLIAEWWQKPVGVGAGVWLNGVGHTLIVVFAALKIKNWRLA